MARNGKVARLPRNIRNTLNSRLDDGEQAADIVQWLNGLPEVQSILAADFHGRPITAQNISEWRKGGFLDWQRSQESCNRIQRFIEAADDLDTAADQHHIPDRLGSILAFELAGETRERLDTTADPRERWRYLCEALRHFSTLRQGERLAARAALERFELETESERREKEEALAEKQRIRDHATRPIFDALRRKTIVTAFGGGEIGEKVADHFQHVDDILRDPIDPGTGAEPSKSDSAALNQPKNPTGNPT